MEHTATQVNAMARRRRQNSRRYSLLTLCDSKGISQVAFCVEAPSEMLTSVGGQKLSMLQKRPEKNMIHRD